MITINKLHSPFLMWLLVLLLFGCQQKNTQARADDSLKVRHLMVQASDTAQQPELRLQWASQAYAAAQKTDSASLRWQAFDAKLQLLQQFEPDSTQHFLESYAKSANVKKDTLNLANAWFKMAQAFGAQEINDSAYFYYNASRALYETLGDSIRTAEKLIYMADLHYRYSDYIEMESATTDALRFINSVPQTATDSIYATIAYNNYGLVSMNLSDFDAALRHYEKALSLTKDAQPAAIVDNNIAYIHLKKEEYAKAIAILSRLKSINPVRDNPELFARVLDNLGYAYMKTGNKEALPYLQQALSIRQREANLFGQIPSDLHLAEYYKKSNPNLAKSYGLQAYRNATVLKSTDDRLDALKFLLDIRGSDPMVTSKTYIALADSIGTVRQKAKNQFAKIKYDAKAANDQNLLLRAETAEKAIEIGRVNRKNLMLYIGIGTIVMGSGGVFHWLRRRNRKEKIREAYQTEVRISKKVHDELANDVYNVMTFAETKDLSGEENKESLLRNLDSVYARARDISRENSPVEMGEAYAQQLREMLTEYSGQQAKVIISGFENVAWMAIVPENKMLVHRILQELMVNMKKHSKASIVALQFVQKGNILEINYTDNGVGMAAGTQFTKNGLRNVENRIMLIGGKYIFDSEPQKGLKITIQLPIKK